ncbi:hypothetical protein GGR52DRAFT_224089 [Hypoxylon sp. FL1284]|nr:hypothetical protein GGR52DRAFT_224089 [Hypoxylon sp. FL1284]
MSASANKTKSATVSGTAGTVTMAPSVSVGTVTSSRFFGNSTIATVAMSAHGVVTVTVVPLPVYTTESVGAVGGTASTTVSNSTVSVGTSVSTAHPNWNMTTFTFTRPTVYETTTTTTFTAPDNCTLGLSMGGTSTTDGVDGMSAGTTGSSSSISIVPIMTTASEEYTSTTTETVTPVVTVDGTTTIFATDPDVVTRTRTVANSYSLLGFTSTIETCGATETATETVTTTVVSTVYASAPSTSTSVETVSISPNSTFTYTDEATGTTSKTPCSTETAVVTPTIDTSTVTTTGAVDGATGSLPNSTISSSATPCNSTRVYTMTVTPTASSSTADIFVSTIVTTITRGPNTTALVTGTIQPYGIEPNTTSTYMTYSHIPNPLGPAAPNGVFPSGFFSTQDSQTSTATSSYGTMPTWLSSIYPAHPMDSGAASAISRRGRRSLWDWWRCTGDDKDPECSYKTCVSWTCSYYAIACMGMVAVVFA